MIRKVSGPGSETGIKIMGAIKSVNAIHRMYLELWFEEFPKVRKKSQIEDKIDSEQIP